MPGGLTRAGNSSESILLSAQTGGGSKDTWVLSHAQPDADDAVAHAPFVAIEPRRIHLAVAPGRRSVLARPLRRADRVRLPAGTLPAASHDERSRIGTARPSWRLWSIC